MLNLTWIWVWIGTKFAVLFHASVVETCLHNIWGLITVFPCEMGIRHRIVNRIYSWISLANVNRFSYILHTTFFDNIESCKAFAMAKCTWKKILSPKILLWLENLQFEIQFLTFYLLETDKKQHKKPSEDFRVPSFINLTFYDNKRRLGLDQRRLCQGSWRFSCCQFLLENQNFLFWPTKWEG